MKKKISNVFIVLSILASFIASIVIPSSAREINNRSFYVTCTLYRPFVLIDLHDEDERYMEGFSIFYSLNNRDFILLDTIDVSNPGVGGTSEDNHYTYMWEIPSAINDMVDAGANVRIRVKMFSADDWTYSTPISIGMVLPDKPIIELYCDGCQLYWTTNFPLEAVSIWTIKVDGVNVSTTSNHWYDISSYFNSYGVLNGNHSFQVTCVLQGYSRVSNVLLLQGVEEFTTPTVDTDLLPGDSPSINSTIASIWSPIKDTKLYQYVFSGLVIVLPLIALLYVIKHVH